MSDEPDYKAILRAAFAQRGTPERPSGCGRVYVAISAPGGLFPSRAEEEKGKADVKGIKAAAKALGLNFQTKNHYGDRNTLYVGYDNCSGIALGRGTAIAAYLNAEGITAHRCESGD